MNSASSAAGKKERASSLDGMPVMLASDATVQATLAEQQVSLVQPSAIKAETDRSISPAV